MEFSLSFWIEFVGNNGHTCPSSTTTWPLVITKSGTPWHSMPSKMLKSTAWWCVLAEILRVSLGSQITMSASDPTAMRPCKNKYNKSSPIRYSANNWPREKNLTVNILLKSWRLGKIIVANLMPIKYLKVLYIFTKCPEI